MYRSSVILNSSRLLAITFVLVTVSYAQAQNSIGLAQPRNSISVLDSTKEQDGLVGSVRRVKTETAKVESKDGRFVEGPMELLELTTYSIKGARVENVSYPAPNSTLGKEEYKYDDRGNITEMTLRDDHGAIVSRESYSYEFDEVGNWTKMTTSLVLFEKGKIKREPIENTYRTITYYFTDDIAKIVDSPPAKPVPTLPATSSTASLEPVKLNVNFANQFIESELTEVGTAPALWRKPAGLRSSVPRIEPNPATEFVGSTKAQTAESEPKSEPNFSRNRLLGLKKAPDSVVPERSDESSAVASAARSDAPVKNVVVPVEDSARNVALGLYGKGLEFFEKDDMPNAIVAFRSSLEFEPSAEVYLNLGNAYLKIEKNNDAVKAFKESLKLNPEAAEAQYGLGLSLYRLKRFVEARGAFTKASTLQPKMAKAYYGLGLSLLELGQPDAVTRVIRILENLDKGLAKKLAQAHPSLNFSCRSTMLCQ